MKLREGSWKALLSLPYLRAMSKSRTEKISLYSSLNKIGVASYGTMSLM